MITRTISFSILAFLLTATAVAQDDQSAPISLDEAFAQLVSYELGDSQTPLRMIRNACWEAMDDAAEAAALEARLIDALEAYEVTFDALRFTCRQLSNVGGPDTVRELSSLIARNSALSHEARTALECVAVPESFFALEELIRDGSIKEDTRQGLFASHARMITRLEKRGQVGGRDNVSYLLKIAVFGSYDPTIVERAAVIARATLAAMRIEGVDESLAESLDDGSPGERLLVASLLGQRGATSQRPALERASQEDDNSSVRVAAFLAIAEFVSPAQAASRTEIYARAIATAETESEITQVLMDLASLPSPEALALAMHHLEGDQAVEAAAAASLIIARSIGDDPDHRELALAAAERVKALIPELAAAGDAIAHIDRNAGFIQTWRVAGPFTVDEGGTTRLFDEAFAPESDDPNSIEWRIVDPNGLESPGIVNLSREIGGDERVAYLMARITSDRDQSARLEIGSDDAVKAWVNGELVHANNVTRGLTLNSDIVSIELREGENTILLKIIQGGGDWKAAARIRAADGARAEGVTLE